MGHIGGRRMNFCTKCASYYQQPGTCNCFAAVRPFLSPYDTDHPYFSPTVAPHDTTVAPPPSPYGTTCIGSNGEIVSSGEVLYDPTVPFTFTYDPAYVHSGATTLAIN